MIKIDFDHNPEGDDMDPEEAMGGVVAILIILMVVLLSFM